VRFLANENFPLDAVEALRTEGHDVAWIRRDAPGSTDLEVFHHSGSSVAQHWRSTNAVVADGRHGPDSAFARDRFLTASRRGANRVKSRMRRAETRMNHGLH
jgi:hypothetical protein